MTRMPRRTKHRCEWAFFLRYQNYEEQGEHLTLTQQTGESSSEIDHHRRSEHEIDEH